MIKMKAATIIIGGLAGAYLLSKLAEAKDTCSDVVDVKGYYIIDLGKPQPSMPEVTHICALRLENKTDKIILYKPTELEIPELKINYTDLKYDYGPPTMGVEFYIYLTTNMPEEIREQLLTKDAITLNIKKLKYKLRFEDSTERECVFSGNATFRILRN